MARKEHQPGTRALVIGIVGLAISWLPIVNIAGFIAGMMAVGLGLYVRTQLETYEGDPGQRTALAGIVVGAAAMAVTVVVAWRYMQAV